MAGRTWGGARQKSHMAHVWLHANNAAVYGYTCTKCGVVLRRRFDARGVLIMEQRDTDEVWWRVMTEPKCLPVEAKKPPVVSAKSIQG